MTWVNQLTIIGYDLALLKLATLWASDGFHPLRRRRDLGVSSALPYGAVVLLLHVLHCPA